MVLWFSPAVNSTTTIFWSQALCLWTQKMRSVLFVKGEWSLTLLMEGKDDFEEVLLPSVTTLISYSVCFVLLSVLIFLGGGLLLYFFSFVFISWRLITLQFCSDFCHTLTWISHGFTCVPHPDPPSHLPLHLIPLGLPSAPGPSTCLMHPAWAGDLFHPR